MIEGHVMQSVALSWPLASVALLYFPAEQFPLQDAARGIVEK